MAEDKTDKPTRSLFDLEEYVKAPVGQAPTWPPLAPGTAAADGSVVALHEAALSR